MFPLQLIDQLFRLLPLATGLLLGPCDLAVAAGVVLLWSATYVLLLVLGPFGLYSPAALRAIVIAVIAALLATLRRRSGGGAVERRPWPAGAWIAIGALALAVVPLFLLQLGSPVSPFMDTLPQAASPERVVTFRSYDPYHNDPTGLWAQTRQMSGHDALFSFVALVAGTNAQLAMTSLIVPFAALQVLALYLLGRAVGGHLTGGFATLFLLQTFVWRRNTDIRGTAIAFTTVAIGLAFLFSRRRTPLRTALGGLALGLSIPVNPLVGVQGPLPGALRLGAVLRFQTGPLGAAPLGWAPLVAAVLPLLVGRAWRLRRAVRR